jgi:hypothetical protein
MGEQLGNFCLGVLATVPHLGRLGFPWNSPGVTNGLSGGHLSQPGWAVATPQSHSTRGAKTKPFDFHHLTIIFPAWSEHEPSLLSAIKPLWVRGHGA